jgi:hypothetical protein
MDQPSHKKQTENWLERMQEQSWEPEIIISGIVLYALYQMPGLIQQLDHFLLNYSFWIFSSGTVDDLLIALLLVANIWLIIGFTSHLFLRSVWIAYIGLSFVYKKGIQTDRLNFRDQYHRLLFRDDGFRDTIYRLEKLCSTTFAISFLLFMSILGAFFAFSVVAALIAISLWLFTDFNDFNWVDTVLASFIVLYIIDFVSLGWLKRIPIISRIYYPIYRLMSWATLSPLYRRIYYGLVSNHSKWKSRLLISVFIIISVFLTLSIRSKTNVADMLALRLSDKDRKSMYPGHYQNLMEDQPSNIVQIPSDIISGKTLRVFLVHRTAFESQYIKPLCDYNNTPDSISIASLKMDCLDAFYDLSLDNQEVETDFQYIKAPITNQEGLVAYLDISYLERGMHDLTVTYNFLHDTTIDPQKVAVVEFYKSEALVRTSFSDTTSTMSK